MDPDITYLDGLAARFQEPGGGDDAEDAVLTYLETVGALLRRGRSHVGLADLAHRPDLLSRALARLVPSVVHSALHQVAAARAAVSDGDPEATARWQDAASEAVETREACEAVIVAVERLLASVTVDAGLQRAIARLVEELAEVDRFALPQVGGLTVSNALRRHLASDVRVGTLPSVAWWLGPRSECPETVGGGRALSSDETVHVETCPDCREDRQRAALLDDMLSEYASIERNLGVPASIFESHPQTALHVARCAECTVLQDALRNAEEVAKALDDLDRLGEHGVPVPPERRVSVIRRYDMPRAATSQVVGTIDGRTCHARVVTVPDAPVGAETELSIVVHDAPHALRGRPVRILWKDGGTLAAGHFERDAEACLPLLPEVAESWRGSSLPTELFADVLCFDDAEE